MSSAAEAQRSRRRRNGRAPVARRGARRDSADSTARSLGLPPLHGSGSSPLLRERRRGCPSKTSRRPARCRPRRRSAPCAPLRRRPGSKRARTPAFGQGIVGHRGSSSSKPLPLRSSASRQSIEDRPIRRGTTIHHFSISRAAARAPRDPRAEAPSDETPRLPRAASRSGSSKAAAKELRQLGCPEIAVAALEDERGGRIEEMKAIPRPVRWTTEAVDDCGDLEVGSSAAGRRFNPWSW